MLLSLIYTFHGVTATWEQVFHGTTIVQFPANFGLQLNRVVTLSPEAKSAGLTLGSPVVSVNGRSFTGMRVLIEELRNRHPGDQLTVGYLAQDGMPRTALLSLVAADTGNRLTWFHIVTQDLLLRILFPICFLTLGCWVVIAKPRNGNAWLLFGIFAYFPSLFFPPVYWPGIALYINPVWADVISIAGPICIMLFGIYFPERADWDKRAPWIKWLILGPLLLLFPLDLLFSVGFVFSFHAISWLASWIGLITWAETTLIFIAIGTFFASVARKIGLNTNPDARRRLRVLYFGSAVANTPIGLLLLYALVHGSQIDETFPRWLYGGALAVFVLFPLTLAYVVIVQRAMDVRILIRQGTKYFFARNTVLVVSILLATWMSYFINRYFTSPGQHRAADQMRIAALAGVFLGFRFVLSKRLQQRIDRRFFREAYSTEQLLSELSDEARSFTEVGPLIDTISSRIGSTLHIERIAVFLRVGDTFELALATGCARPPGKTLSLTANSATISALARSKSPAIVYRDDPSSWLVDATDEERSALADLSTELLVPLPGRNRLIGVMALGPKSSEEPYSRTDRQLLQTVASQTGLALENAELLENLTVEISQRERISREIEIAREVQQRLFPQVYPHVAGIDLAGHCRPAQAVGGDYYDFFLLPPRVQAQPRLAIAIGDISGKGISAALLMASLRASLRSIAALQAESDSADLTMLMRSVNRLVFDSSTDSRYATFFYAEYDPATRLLTYVNAGHNPPILLRGDVTIALEPTGMVIGLMPDAEYQQVTIQLCVGDTLFAYTDGISEAMTHDEEEWGEKRMMSCAQQFLCRPGKSKPASSLLDCIFRTADMFTGGAPQHDDMTLLVCSIS
ncbi:SpoIIE family protein phosphatase [Granulicella arctica]|uniref:SpoIIE family protein phosphatase n=1 Tax=Granulicella arctica TaxID=940613 RepID=UPI0021DFACDD|nr:SpoIIE family protein phosphatase [Granulicella arctica]